MIEFVLFIVIIVPISLFWHELGHLLGAKLMRATHITLTIGTGKPILKWTFNNMTFIINRLFIFHSLTETNSFHTLSKKDKFVITLMGPISSLLLSFITFCFDIFLFNNVILVYASLFNLWLGIVNLLPFKINEKQSDGYTILQIIKMNVEQ